ncbi:hypothetical protein BN946_scf184844.g45 [Trametes cinnabarina]|uniref:DUF6699 domain-containing protein n=1 Tax=Pycnoporus cinnabarinus TaxID=5643 RepID=A0A060S9Y0_PYCCI|nr:hypothetical protein BN946_scf184844.g45 [Trametes cinnabarina]
MDSSTTRQATGTNPLGSRFGPREPRQRSSGGGGELDSPDITSPCLNPSHRQPRRPTLNLAVAKQGLLRRTRQIALPRPTDRLASCAIARSAAKDKYTFLPAPHCRTSRQAPDRRGPRESLTEWTLHRQDGVDLERRRKLTPVAAVGRLVRGLSIGFGIFLMVLAQYRRMLQTAFDNADASLDGLLDPHRPIDLDNNSSPPPPSRPRRQRDGSMSPVPMSPLRLNRPLLPNEQLVPTVRPDQMLPGDYVIPTPPATDSRGSHISNSRNVQESSAPARQSSDRAQQSSALVQQTSAAPAVPVDQWDPDTMSFVPRGTRRRLRPPSPPPPPLTRESHVSQPSRSTLPQQAQPYLPIYGYYPAAWPYPWAPPQRQPAASMSSESRPQSARQPRTFLPTPLYTSSGQAILPNEPGLNHPGRGFPPPSVGVSRYNYPTLHPMLMENPRKPYAPPPLQWDVRCPPYTAKYITPRAQVVPISPQQWDMPFTKEKVTEAQIHINHNMLELLRHTPHVHIQQSTPITVKDVLCAIYDWLQELVRPPERDRLKERYPQLWSMAEEAFRRRCLTCPHIAIPAAEWRKGMKRVDLLTDLVMWSGMYVVHTEDSRWFLRVSLLQPADVDPRWHFQGGSRVSH